jgi:DNA invertase Pin-like site-specific DNA recombinase
MQQGIKTITFADAYLIYNRKSTDDPDNQKNALGYQRQRNIEFSLANNLRIADITVPGFCTAGIVDESHSGFKEEEEFEVGADGTVQYRILRPKFLKMIGVLKNREIRGAIFLCWDRASRNKQDDMLLKKLMRLGCDIRFVEATYDKTSSGELHMDIDGMFAAHYSRVISEKVRNAYAKMRAEGRCIYAAPLGYLDHGSDNKPYDPERARLVKRIFELYATGEWSFTELANWARQQGLTKKPHRRKRSRDEILNNVDASTLNKITRPVDHKSIEYILKNPFYAGKIKVGDGYQEGRFHQPLVSMNLFSKVQGLLKSRNVSIHYIEKRFFTYRGLARCTCGRLYTPYEQKEHNYYRSRCPQGCSNSDPNLTERNIIREVRQVMGRIHLSDEELSDIEQGTSTLHDIDAQRHRALDDLKSRLRTTEADLHYLNEHKLTLLRTGAMTIEAIQADEYRLTAKLAEVEALLAARAASAHEMLTDILSFSQLARKAFRCYDGALDIERRNITTDVFSELVFRDRVLVSYTARSAFGAFLNRSRVTGSPVTLVSELLKIYPAVRATLKEIGEQSVFTRIGKPPEPRAKKAV